MDIVTGLIMGALNGGGGGSSSHGVGDVCTLIVDFCNSGIGASVEFFVCYARLDSVLGGFSIEGAVSQYYGNDLQGRFYVPVCVPKESDEFKAFIYLPDTYSGMDISLSGAVTGPEELLFLSSRNPKTWVSVPASGYRIQGDAEITISAP